AAIDIVGLREIASTLRGGGHGADEAARISYSPAFQREEIEQLVFDDRVAQRTSVHMLARGVVGEAGAIRLGVEPRIAAQVEARAVPVVVTGFHRHAD